MIVDTHRYPGGSRPKPTVSAWLCRRWPTSCEAAPHLRFLRFAQQQCNFCACFFCLGTLMGVYRAHPVEGRLAGVVLLSMPEVFDNLLMQPRMTVWLVLVFWQC